MPQPLPLMADYRDAWKVFGASNQLLAARPLIRPARGERRPILEEGR